MSELADRNLIYDWNLLEQAPPMRRPELEDRTLCEGMIAAVPIHSRLKLLHLQEKLRMDASCLGWPAASDTEYEMVRRLAREVRDEGFNLRPSCSVHPARKEIHKVKRLSEEAGEALETCIMGDARDASAAWHAVQNAVNDGLVPRVMLEHASVATPGDLRKTIASVAAEGAVRVCLRDTEGVCSPSGASRLMAFATSVIEDNGCSTVVEWMGRNDRDLGIINSLVAFEHGARRLHGTVLGLGQGAGWTPLDLLAVNLCLMEVIHHDLTPLREYCQVASEVFGTEIAVNYPVFGEDAFRTATGVHAAAIIKAQAKGHAWLADRVYSGVPAATFGRHQTIDVGPMSGESNVVAWLRAHDLEPAPQVVKRIIARAKKSTHTLTQQEILAEIE